jgi:subtilisin family serine protease
MRIRASSVESPEPRFPSQPGSVEEPVFTERPGAGPAEEDTFEDRPQGVTSDDRPVFTPELIESEPAKIDPAAPPVFVVMDGAVQVDHPDLDSAMWVNPNEIAGDGIDNDSNGVVDDLHGFNVARGDANLTVGAARDHGTHIAGIVAAEDNGQGNTGIAAGKAKIMSVGGIYDRNDLLVNFERAVDYVVRMKLEHGVNIRVVNASFGRTERPQDVARWQAAIQRLADADILLVAATANGNGSNMNNVRDMPANVDLPNVITVASMDRTNERLASFSSHGDRVVELAAVGDNVLSTIPGGGWGRKSGTSMATPTVGAAATLLFSINPNLTAVQARDILLRTVAVDPDLAGKVSTGGKLDIDAAVAAAQGTLTQPQAA